MEYERVYQSDSGTEVTFRIKAECHTQEELEKELSFFAKSSRRFYLEAGSEIKRMPSEGQASHCNGQPLIS